MFLLGDDRRLVISASDLRTAAACEFALVRDLDVALGRAERVTVDDDPLARLPGAVDAVLGAVRAQRAVDLVGEPEQGELAQSGEVAQAEVVRQCRVDPLGGVDDAGRKAVAQRLRREVDDLDLVGAARDGIRHGLALRDPGDLLDHVVERFDVLHVDRRDDVDAGIQDLGDVLPALLVA